MSIEVAMFGLKVNAVGCVVSPSVGRIPLEDLDRRRAAHWDVADQRIRSGALNFYLMSPLEAETTVPDDAIDAIKLTLGREFRSNSNVARTLKQLFTLGVDRTTPQWALVESLGSQLAVRAAHEAFSQEFLSKAFQEWPVMQPADFSPPSGMRILVEYVTAEGAQSEPVDADWNQLAARLATYADLRTNDIRTADIAEKYAPSDSPRDVILARSVTAADAVRRAGTYAEDAATWASRERKAGRLFGIWSGRDRAFLHPDFQFKGAQVHPCLPDLLRVLRVKTGFNPASTDKGGWGRAYWLYQPRAELSPRALAARRIDATDPVTSAVTLSLIGDDRPRSPAEAFATQPHIVIELAESLLDEGAVTHD